MNYLGYGGTSTIFKGALCLCYRLKTNKLKSDIHVNMPQKRKFSLSPGRKHNRTIKRSAHNLKAIVVFHYPLYTLLNRLYGVWQRDLFTWYFRFQSTCNRNKFVWFSRWISGFCITKSRKECHWTAFYPPNTLREREYNLRVVRMFLHEFSHKQCAETSVHRATHHAVTKMTIVNFLVNVLQHNFNKQF